MIGALGRTRRSRGRWAASLLASAGLIVATLTVPTVTQAFGGVVAASPKNAYAYVGGAAKSPSSCPRTARVSSQCTLTQALALVSAGGAVLLASGGKSTYYGNFAIGTAHTSARAAVTLKPVPGLRHVVISGDGSGKVPCPTGSCSGAVLSVGTHEFAHVQSVTITDGNNTGVQGGGGITDLGALTLSSVTISQCKAQVGGAVAVDNGASLTVSDSTFSGDSSTFFGGAIDVGSVIGKVNGSGRLTVTGSTFSNDRSQRGGAIDSGDVGTGTLTVTRSTFSSDSASKNGGAIDNADSGSGTAFVTDSTFSRDTAHYGGAIDNADSGGTGALTVVSSTFSQDSAVHGGAIDNAERGNGTVSVRTSTFYADRGTQQGAAIDSADAGGTGSVVILDSTIDGNHGAAALSRLGGSIQLAGSILAGPSAPCTSAITDLGYNLASSTTPGCGLSPTNNDLTGVNPRLGSLQRNGGPTATLMPSRSSPALEQIPNPAVADLVPGKAKASLCPVPDQRGVRRTEAVGCAIGSVDPANAVPVVTSVSPSPGAAAGGGSVVIRGGNFRSRASVRFGTVSATHVTVVSAARIKARVPALPASNPSRVVTVTVRNPSGRTSPYRALAIYTYYTSDWSAYLGGASHSSFNPGAKSISARSIANLQAIWQWQPPASPNSGRSDDDASPIVFHGVIYVGLQDGEMYAIKESTRQILWSRFLGVELANTCKGITMGVISTATVVDDSVTGKPTVYVNAPDGYLYALNAATGAVLWKSVVGIPSPTIDDYYAWGSPTVANGKVYIGIASNCDIPLVQAGVLAFNQHSGKRLAYWDSLPPTLVGASTWGSVAVLPNGNVVATTGNAQGNLPTPHEESIVVLDGSTLRLLGSWMAPQSQAPGDSDFGASPTVFTAYPSGVATTMIGACNKDGIYYALRANDVGAGPLWEHRMGVPTTGAMANECDAAAIWNGRYLIEGGGSAVTIGGTTYDGSVQALNPTTGKPVWQTGVDGWVVGSPSEDAAGVVAAPVFFSPLGVTGVYLLSASTGKILKFISTEPRGVFAQPVFDGSELLVGDESAALPLMAYAVTRPGQRTPLKVSPAVVTPGTTVTLTLTGKGGFTSPANVTVSGVTVVVQSVQINSKTKATVKVKVLSDAVTGTTLNITLVEPNLKAYSGSLVVG